MIAVPEDANAKKRGKSGKKKPRTELNHKPDKKITGAPLDGGILTILGAAGVAYYVARKKKKLVE